MLFRVDVVILVVLLYLCAPVFMILMKMGALINDNKRMCITVSVCVCVYVYAG